MSEDDEGMAPSRRGSGAQPTRTQSDLADVIEILLEKGVVINADIAVSIGDTELLGVQIRAALASFETAAEYGLEFPTGTDMRRVEAASGREELDDEEVTVGGGAIEGETEDEGDEASDDDETEQRDTDEETAPEADGGSPVAPLHRPPVAENAPWLHTPPITEDPEETDTEDDERPRVEPGTATRPSESGESTNGSGADTDDSTDTDDGTNGDDD